MSGSHMSIRNCSRFKRRCWAGDITIGKGRPVIGNRVDMRRGDISALIADITVTQIVSKYENEVRLPGDLRCHTVTGTQEQTDRG